MKYKSTKQYGTWAGLSATFRQWRADGTHCKYLHGYALGFKFTFEAENLDSRNWVYNFGDCKWIKAFLEDTFDHKTVISFDDPYAADFIELDKKGIIQLRFLDKVGCEAFAEYVFKNIYEKILSDTSGRVKLTSVVCFEHEGNSAIYEA